MKSATTTTTPRVLLESNKTSTELAELAEIIDVEKYIDNRDSTWLKIIWSLRSDGDNNLELALNLTRKSKYYKDDDSGASSKVEQ